MQTTSHHSCTLYSIISYRVHKWKVRSQLGVIGNKIFLAGGLNKRMGPRFDPAIHHSLMAVVRYEVCTRFLIETVDRREFTANED